jgi:hypothetical protein
VLIELNEKRELYTIAHRLVSADPESAISWFAVVSFYCFFKLFLGLPLLFDPKV